MLRLIAVVMLLSLAACSDKPSKGAGSSSSKPETAGKDGVVVKNQEKAPLLAADDKMMADLVQRTPSTSIPNEEVPVRSPEVIDNASNVIRQVRSEVKNDTENGIIKVGRTRWTRDTPVPSRSLAAKLPSKDDIVIKWTPVIMKDAARRPRIPDAKLSHDGSVFAFIETIGSQTGPFGSRIVLLNAHTWEIINVFDNKNRNISRIEFIPGTRNLAAICEKQLEMKQPYGLAVINLANGRERSFIRIPKEGAGRDSMLAAGNGKVYLASPDSAEIFVVNTRRTGADDETADTENTLSIDIIQAPGENSKLARSMTEGFFGAAANGKIIIYKFADNRPFKNALYPIEMRFENFYFMDDGKSFLFCPPRSAMNPPAVVRNTEKFPLSGISDGFGIVSSDGDKIITVNAAKSVIDIRNSHTLETIDTIETTRLPNSKKYGKPRDMFNVESNSSLAVLDDAGNFWLIFKPEGSKSYSIYPVFTSSSM